MTPSTFPALLASARRRKGWSQSDLARACRCAPSTVCKFESGERSPSRDALGVLIVALELTGPDVVAIFAPMRAPAVRRPRKATP